MDPTELRTSLKQLIIETLRLEGVKPETIVDDAPLFSPIEGLGLDSLSALEILSAIEFKYAVRFASDGSAKQHFKSVATLASYLGGVLGPEPR